jgi:hypothetical protein
MNLLKKQFSVYHSTSLLAKQSHCEKIKNKFHPVDLCNYLGPFRKIRINPFSNLLFEFILE